MDISYFPDGEWFEPRRKTNELLIFDKAKRSYSLAINWMGRQLKLPIFNVGPRQPWSANA